MRWMLDNKRIGVDRRMDGCRNPADANPHRPSSSCAIGKEVPRVSFHARPRRALFDTGATDRNQDIELGSAAGLLENPNSNADAAMCTYVDLLSVAVACE